MAATQFQTRTITALLFVTLLVSSVLASVWSLFFLFLFFTLIAVNEFKQFFSQSGKSHIFVFFGSVIVFVLPSLIVLNYLQFGHLALSLLLIPLAFTLGIASPQDSDKKIAYSVLSWVYVTIPFALVVPFAMISGAYTPWLLLGYFFLLWGNDTGAYLIGKSIGKNKLAAHISPGKTIEGFVGGVLVAMLVAYLNFKFIGIIELQHWIFCALITSIVGTLGDLVESSMKRKAQIKDSGNIMPGHGGILDRFDGLLLSLPVVFVYLCYIFMDK